MPYARGYTAPTTLYAPACWVYLKETWADDEGDPVDWQFYPEFEVESVSDVTAGQDLDKLVFRRRYGRVQQPWESSVSTVLPLTSGCGWWVMATIVHAGGEHPIFVGRVGPSTRKQYGDELAASGVQSWTAYGPGQILRNYDIAVSHWDSGYEATNELGWLPPINSWMQSQEFGNRCWEKIDGAYAYGSGAAWSHYDYLEYLLKHFFETEDGPVWSLSGQADVLKQIKAPIDFGEKATAYEIIRKLIPLSMGLDFSVISNEDGFSIWVYSLSRYEAILGSVTVPGNPHLVWVDTADSSIEHSVVEEDGTQQRGSVYVRSKRAVCVCSLRGSSAQGFDSLSGTPALVPGWEDADETAYKAATGSADTDDPAANDAARELDVYRDVFRKYQADDSLDPTALLRAIDDAEDYIATGCQTVFRETLEDLPDSFTLIEPDPEDPKVDERRRATVWIDSVDEDNPWSTDAHYTLVTRLGMAVSTLDQSAGIYLDITPPHTLARGDWSGAAASNTDPSVFGGYEHTTLIATLAIPSDQRYTLAIAESTDPNDGRREILTDAEAWGVAENTVDTIVDGQPVNAPSGWARLDREALDLAAAGARQRYLRPRHKAAIQWRGIWPWCAYVGMILAEIDGQPTDAPITGVTYTFSPDGTKTHLDAGFAL